VAFWFEEGGEDLLHVSAVIGLTDEVDQVYEVLFDERIAGVEGLGLWLLGWGLLFVLVVLPKL
jgi:hypothetical protein